MINIVCSSSSDSNKDTFVEAADPERGNIEWLASQLPKEEEGVPKTFLLLLGGASTLHFRLRVAQSHARHDMTPSHWSHAALLVPDGDGLPSWAVREIAFDPKNGFDFPPDSNGLLVGPLSRYDSPKEFPNIAFIDLPIDRAKVEEAVASFRKGRVHVDAVGQLVSWLGFLWGVGAASNPLVQAIGIPSAAFVGAVASWAGFDLTPGLGSQASCPEAIWQSARWWDYPREINGQQRKLAGKWNVRQRFFDGT